MPVITSNHHHNSKEGVIMIINTNMGSSTAARILANNTSALQKSLKRLSTGSKIASVSDDAAGVAVAGKFQAEIKRLGASKDNLANMVSFSQTQDGYMNQISSALQRMSELAMLASDQTKNSSDRALYESEFDKLQDFIDDTTKKQFNGISLFSGNNLAVQTGLSDSVTVTAVDLSGALSVLAPNTVTVTGTAEAAVALTQIQHALTLLSSGHATVGGNLSRLEHERNAISILRDNMASAKSRILDVDVAEESANFAKQQILVQSGTAMLAQANVIPQSALRLIS
jgi:flagellin